MYRIILSLFAILFIMNANAQQRSIGRWHAHMPYNNAQGLCTDGSIIYFISRQGFVAFHTDGSESVSYSKVEGMHESKPIAIAYDRSSATAIIGYDNSNIDLFRHQNFTVLPDLKNKSFSGSKRINGIWAERGFAYLSTTLGIVVIDLDRQEVKETYVFSKGAQTIEINAFTGDSTYFYAASASGLYRIARSSPTPQVFAAWQPVDTARDYTKITFVRNTLWAATSGFTDTLYRIAINGTGTGTRQRIWFSDSTSITHIDGIDSILYAGTLAKTGTGRIYHFNPDNAIIDSTSVAYTNGVIATDDGRQWVADGYQGIGSRDSIGRVSLYVPNGPADADCADIYARGGEVWVAHGGIRPNYTALEKTSGISHYTSSDDRWNSLNPYSYPLFRDSVVDFVSIVKDERTGTLYAGTAASGIYERAADGTGQLLKQGALQGSGDGYPLTGMAIDANGALWVNQIFLNNELAVRTADGEWHYYHVDKLARTYAGAGAKIIVDDENQKWYFAPYSGGVIVYNDGGTPETGTDDQARNLTIGKGLGNLPSNTVLSLVKDRDGAIWIGTDKGITIVSNPGSIFQTGVDADQPVVQYDQFAGLLFSNEAVSAMAVDGANRKWIGTGNGVWLLSADARKIINRFTVDNSPLPSNNIQSITVDQVTGDVYFGTSDGLVSYRGTATEGTETAGSIVTFPNPVPSGYTGPIALRGLTTDADVRITDIAGQLIYRAKATGGQVVWNGQDYTGHQPQSGVLLIFATNKDGTQTATGKMVMMH